MTYYWAWTRIIQPSFESIISCFGPSTKISLLAGLVVDLKSICDTSWIHRCYFWLRDTRLRFHRWECCIYRRWLLNNCYACNFLALELKWYIWRIQGYLFQRWLLRLGLSSTFNVDVLQSAVLLVYNAIPQLQLALKVAYVLVLLLKNVLILLFFIFQR